jgi:hypothetical protein
MRCKFNRGRYWQRLRKGELTAKMLRDRHPAPPSSGQPHCTRSQMLSYLDSNNQEVARVHQYVLPNNTVKGKPDPKRLFYDGVLYHLASLPQSAPTNGPRSNTLSVAMRRSKRVLMMIWGPLRCLMFRR